MAVKAKGKLLDACRAALRIPAFVTDYDEEYFRRNRSRPR